MAGSLHSAGAARPQAMPTIVRAHGQVRGTQSFVAVMSRVWRHPGWTALEVGWRWCFAALALLLLHHYAVNVWHGALNGPHIVGAVDLSSLGSRQPAEQAVLLTQAAVVLWPPVFAVARWLGPLLAVLWVLSSACGRSLVMWRIDAEAKVHAGTQLALAALRLGSILLVLLVWARGLMWSAESTITGEVAHGREPNLVGFCALVVIGTLVLFVAWSLAGWIFAAAPLVAFNTGDGVAGSLGRSLRFAGRMKLVEISLVMGITRVALIVLFLVFSACPLPFESVESADFLQTWTAGCFVLYLIASDYFHVVRAASFAAMLRAYGE